MNKIAKNSSGSSRLLIIGGLSRSGTSMLQRICNAHPQIVMTYESRILLNTGRRFSGYFRGFGNNWQKKFRRLAEANGSRQYVTVWRFLTALMLRGYRRIDLAAIHHALESVFPQAACVGDKYPRYLFHLSEFVDYDDMRIVIIYRDGRDVAQSILQRVRTDWKDQVWAQNKLSTPQKIAARWVEAIEQMERYCDQIHIIRYETLVNNPEAEFARLAEYLGVDPAGFDYSGVKTNSIGKYKQGLTEEQLAEFMEVAGPTLERLGYGRTPNV